MEQFELTVNARESLTLLTKVLMMFSRRRISVVTVQSESTMRSSISRIRFLANRTDAYRIQMQVQKTVDIMDANLLWIQPAEVQKASLINVV
jgi:acetolactate synthase regulatory subunit